MHVLCVMMHTIISMSIMWYMSELYNCYISGIHWDVYSFFFTKNKEIVTWCPVHKNSCSYDHIDNVNYQEVYVNIVCDKVELVLCNIQFTCMEYSVLSISF